MTIRRKLVIAFGIVASIPLVGGVLGVYSHHHAVEHAKSAVVVSERGRKAIDNARRAQVCFKIQVQEWKDILLRGHDQAAFDKYFAGFVAAEQNTDAGLSEVVALAPDIGLKPASVETLRAEHAELGRKYREALRQFKIPDAATSFAVDKLVQGVDREPTQHFDALVEEISRLVGGGVKSQVAGIEEAGSKLEFLMISGTILGVILGIVFGVFVSNAVMRHIREVAGRMWDRTAEVATAAGQMAASSQSVARTSAEQAAGVDETMSALTQVNATVKENAERARKAREVSQGNRIAVDQGASEIAEMQTAMHEIATASGNIAKIVKSIDEIAFQTNILALNAAVEAARAGESGAGFAVVADEVRNLAQRSAHAARETATKIEDATAKSSRGAELATRVGVSLKRVIENAHRVDGFVGEIAHASTEQAHGLEQAVASMRRIGELTSANAAASEETASGAQTLETQAERLRGELSGLLNRHAAHADAAVAPAAAQVAESAALAA